jgi:hypothetical protein
VHVIIDNSQYAATAIASDDELVADNGSSQDGQKSPASGNDELPYRDDVRLSSSLPLEENTVGKLLHLLVRANRKEFFEFHPKATAVWQELERADASLSDVDMISRLTAGHRSILFQFLIMLNLDSSADLAQFTDERLSNLSEQLRRAREDSRTIKELHRLRGWLSGEIANLEGEAEDGERLQKLKDDYEQAGQELKRISGSGDETITAEDFMQKVQLRVLLERHNLQNLPIGRDRLMRQYWIFPGVPGLFVSDILNEDGEASPSKRQNKRWWQVPDIKKLQSTLDRHDNDEMRLRNALYSYQDLFKLPESVDSATIEPPLTDVDLQYQRLIINSLKRLSSIVIQPFSRSPRSPKYRHFSTLRPAWASTLPSEKLQDTVINWLRIVNQSLLLEDDQTTTTTSNESSLTAGTPLVSPSSISPLLFCFLPHDTKMIRLSEMNAVRRAIKRLQELVRSNGNCESLLFYIRILEATIEETIEEDENYAGVQFTRDPWREQQQQSKQAKQQQQTPLPSPLSKRLRTGKGSVVDNDNVESDEPPSSGRRSKRRQLD